MEDYQKVKVERQEKTIWVFPKNTTQHFEFFYNNVLKIGSNRPIQSIGPSTKTSLE